MSAIPSYDADQLAGLLAILPDVDAVELKLTLPADVPQVLRDRDGFKVEVDASPAGFTCSCSLTAEAPDRKVTELIAGACSLADVLDDAQRGMMLERMPPGVELADVVVLGTINLLKARFHPEGYGRRMVAELWFLPDGSRILELSAKATPAEAFQAAAETKVFLAGKGIDLAAPQETKTRSALAALLADRAGPGTGA